MIQWKYSDIDHINRVIISFPHKEKIMSNKLVIATYLRLSKEDDPTEDESNSITSQRYLLERFTAENFTDYELLEYADDGYSGTNMNRPGMNALLKAAEEGQLYCVIVKDFSRFSRDYIELGTYIEQIFPFLHIRFISVGDHYDSQDTLGMTADIDTNFRSLLYDFYSKDLSVKVKSALTAKKENGEYACANAPFGYRKDAKDRHRLLVVPQEGEIIRKIYNLAADGMSSMEIALLLNREQVKTPIQFKIEAGETKRIPKGDQFTWSGQGICRILENPFYAGDMVYGKYEQQTVGGSKVLKPKSSWRHFPGHHPAIIDQQLFELVQRGRGKTRPKQVRERHYLTSRMICGACSKKMRIRYGKNPYFTCTDRYVTENEACVTAANVKWIEELLLFLLEQEWRKGGNQADSVRHYHQKMQGKSQEEEKMKEILHEKLRILLKEQQEAYEQYVLGGRKDNRFLEERKIYQAEIITLQEKIREAEGKRVRIGEDATANLQFEYYSRAAAEIFLVSIIMIGTNRVEMCWNFNSKFV
jgi:DNA invertase Pin-like site-specific DNA recombinase